MWQKLLLLLTSLLPHKPLVPTLTSYDIDLFNKGVAYVQEHPLSKDSPTMCAATIPHHLVASHLIAQTMYHISLHQPRTLVIIGPNHQEVGPAIATTPIDSATDQSLTSLRPFIRHYLPSTQVISLLIRQTASLDELDALTNRLAPLLTSPNTVLLASIDFSHYLPLDQANLKDQVTQNLVDTKNYSSIKNLSSDYLDSPGSLITYLKLIDKLGCASPALTYHQNSGELEHQPLAPSTSYLVYNSYRPSPSITIITTGDVMLGRTVNIQTLRSGDFTWPWVKTADVLRQADVTFINLEGPLVPNCSPSSEGLTFCADPRQIQGLKFAGVDVANLANNHTSNYGQTGLDSTVQLLTDAKIKPTGVSGPVYLTVKGHRLAFLGYNTVGVPVADTPIASEIRQVKTKSDLVIVAFHWGNEYTTEPTSQQKYLAHLAIDSGADLVVGNHPHWIQPTEYYKDKLIVYSHGNFIFDQMWSNETRKGIVGKFTFSNNKLTDTKFLPIQIDSFGQPHF